MATEAEVVPGQGAERVTSSLWWLPLVLGIGWVVVALAILQFDLVAVKSITVVLGVVLLAAALHQIIDVFTGPGWRLLHASLGLVYLAGAITALAWPSATFLVAAHLLAWYLLLKGVSDVVSALIGKGELEFWGLLLFVGVLEMGVAFWAVSYSGRSSALLVLWVALAALAKGVTSIVTAFELRPPTTPHVVPPGSVPAPARGTRGIQTSAMR